MVASVLNIMTPSVAMEIEVFKAEIEDRVVSL